MSERTDQNSTFPGSEENRALESYSERQVRDAARLLDVVKARHADTGTNTEINCGKPLFLLEKLSKIALEHALEAEMSDGLLSDSHREYSLVARCAMQIVIREMSDGDAVEVPESDECQPQAAG
jgi:hypothetical protein